MVKGQTQKGHRPPLSSNPKHSKNENSLKKQALGEPYAVHVRCTLLFTRLGSNSRVISRHLGITWATVRKPPIQATKPAALKQEVPQLQQGLPGTASLPPHLRPQGGPTGGGSSVVLIRSPPTQQQPPCRATSAMRWVTLVTFSIGA